MDQAGSLKDPYKVKCLQKVVKGLLRLCALDRFGLLTKHITALSKGLYGQAGDMEGLMFRA